jgi:hypothetical protein
MAIHPPYVVVDITLNEQAAPPLGIKELPQILKK